jgi:hypothetical protein
MTEMQVIRGDFKVFEITITDEITGLPFDLTDADVIVTVRDRPDEPDGSPAALFVKTDGDGIAIQDQITDTGIALVSIYPEDTVDLPNQHTAYDFDVKVVRNTFATTPIRGSFRVTPTIGDEV